MLVSCVAWKECVTCPPRWIGTRGGEGRPGGRRRHWCIPHTTGGPGLDEQKKEEGEEEEERGGGLKKVGKIGSGIGRKKREPAGGSRREGQVEEEKGVTGRERLVGKPSEGGHNGLTRSRASGGYSCCEIAESGSPRCPRTRILQSRTGYVFGK